jgi:tetratricopeptide (TPR) repeat protein
MGPGGRIFVVTGKFWKKFSVTSKPEGASIYVDNLLHTEGVTPLKNLPLKAGTTHFIRLTKTGFEPWQTSITVEPGVKSDIQAYLKKNIIVSAYEKGGAGKDIGAYVTVSGAGIVNRKTPFRMALPLKEYTFTYKKEPRYMPVSFTRNIKNAGKRISAGMGLKPPYLRVEVKDYDTRENIESAKIWINGSYWKRTGRSGAASGFAHFPGRAKIRVNAKKYQDFRTVAYLEKAEKHYVSIKLGTPTDAILIVDASGFKNSSIYIDGEHAGDRYQRIFNVSRSKHEIEIKADEMKDAFIENIKITEPDYFGFYRLVKDGKKVFLEKPDYSGEENVFKLLDIKREAENVLKASPHHSGTQKFLLSINRRLNELSENTDALLEEANKLYRDGKYKEFLRFCNEVLGIGRETDFGAQEKLKDALNKVEDIKRRQKELERIKRASEFEEEIRRHYRRGIKDYDNLEYELALMEFEKAMDTAGEWGNDLWQEKLKIKIDEIKKHLTQQHYKIGYNYYLRNQLEEAVSEFKKTLSYDPFNKNAIERLKDARDKLVDIKKERALGLYQWGVDNDDIKKIEESISVWKEVLAVYKSDAETQKKIKEAEDRIEEITQRQVRNQEKQRELEIEREVSVYYNRGMGHYDKTKFLQALGEFRSGLAAAKKRQVKNWIGIYDKKIKETNEKLSEKHYEKGHSYYQKNQLSRAKEEFRKALFYNPGNSEAKKKLNEVGDKIDRINEKKVEQLYRKGVDECDSGNIQKAVDLFRQALKYDPDNKEALKALREAEDKLKVEREKVDEKVNKLKAEELYKQGMDEYTAGDLEEAVSLWEKALEYDPGHKETSKAIERAREKLKAREE